MRRIAEPMGDGLTRLWEVDEVLFEARTPFQEVLIGQTSHGVTLFCDNERQSADASQLVYHEALMVPSMLLASQLDRVLVIGSSEGVVCEMAVAAGASHVDHVDIDTEAVKACAAHLPYGYTTSALERAERGEGPIHVHYEDGFKFLANSGLYDLIVIDLPDENTDPEAQHNRLYGTEFLRECASHLTEGGVLSCQAGCPTLWRNETLLASWRRFSEVFGTVLYYGSDEHEWAFLSGRLDQADVALEDRLAGFPYRPSTLDASALRGGTVPPHSLRMVRP
ncbi:spermidine synthase [Amycolatopsis sp. cg5]|uniref:spermidine synthase n=1 Tax=Amycolatopsis sp. cg5 TaxID=3238802 RepID=UPI003526AC48